MEPSSAGTLHYARHFVLLTGVVAVLAAANRWSHAAGAVASFGIYGALHASTVSATLRRPQPLWRKLVFVAFASALSMLSALVCFHASRFFGRLPGMAGYALLLTLASGLGAASYASLMRLYFRSHLSPRAVGSITLGCVMATLAVLLSGAYLRGGGFCFAAFWWFAFSIGLWHFDGRGRQAY
jgi:hypothetical protein